MFDSHQDNQQGPQLLKQPYVSTAQVAQALGVSVTTVKRWVDENVLPAHRTAGGHRKLLMSDVLRLVREGNLPQADLTRLLPKTGTTAADPYLLYKQLIQVIRVEDYDMIRSIIHGAYQVGISMETIADVMIAPALMDVGHQWATGVIDVMKEHRITQSFISALYELRAILRLNAEANRPVALIGSPEGDHYIMASLVVKLCLLDHGWDAINLGPNTPVGAFQSAIRDYDPQLVCLSVSHIATQEHFMENYKSLYRICYEQQIPLALGGRALHEGIRSQLPYTTYGDGMTQLCAFAQSIHRRPTLPKRGRPIGSGSKQKSSNEASTADETTSES